mgnify:CR=1 FL=1
MSTWLARLKNQNTPGAEATKPTKPTQDTPEGGFVGFVAHPQGHIQKIDGAVANPETPAANAPAIDPDRWAWPHSDAWNTGEIELFNRRAALFVRRGANDVQAEALADRLVRRDREEDDRHLCHECRHLRCGLPGWICGNGAAAGIAVSGWGAGLPAQLVAQLQRCPGFAAEGLPATAPTFVAAPAPAAAPARSHATGPDRSPAAQWRELDRTYLAHHQQCTACQCAGQGYGERCAIGMPLWTAYSSASH